MQTLSEYRTWIEDKCAEMLDELPHKEALAKGVVGSLVISGFITRFSPAGMLTAAALSATATLVDGAAKRFFERYLAADDDYSPTNLAVKQVIVYGIVAAGAALIGLPLHLVSALIVANVVFRAVFGNENDLSTDSALPYIFG